MTRTPRLVFGKEKKLVERLRTYLRRRMRSFEMEGLVLQEVGGM